MTPMTGFGILLRKELREQWRSSRLPVVAVIFLALGLLSPLMAYYTPEILKLAGGGLNITLPTPTAGDAVDQFLKNMSQLAPFVAILLAMGEVARERERGTAAFVLTKPVTRPAFLAAKFVALLATLGVSVLLAGAATYFYTAVLFKTLPLGGFTASAGLALLALMVTAALTFLASTLVRSSLPAGGMGLGAFLLLAILSSLPRLGRYTPQGLLTPAHALALGQATGSLAGPLLVNLGLIAAALALAWLAFRGQEIEG
ncbi:MAG TPA: ABC transporter permease subunit [Thermomicrobiaceae bacterium]|nr:ABC transporter permease subunit [Thermomicrobiaceae bacterium]